MNYLKNVGDKVVCNHPGLESGLVHGMGGELEVNIEYEIVGISGPSNSLLYRLRDPRSGNVLKYQYQAQVFDRS